MKHKQYITYGAVGIIMLAVSVSPLWAAELHQGTDVNTYLPWVADQSQSTEAVLEQANITSKEDDNSVPSFEPQSVIDVEFVQPFSLKRSYKYSWRYEQPAVQTGLLVVLKVNPELVIPRNALEPVLYAGNQTVQRLNHGHESGFVIGIIPEQIDLSEEPIWFGTPALPERIDAETIARERAKAKESGISGPVSEDIESRTQDPVTASDLTALLREQAADLVLEFSPQEKRLADSWQLPVTKPQTQP